MRVASHSSRPAVEMHSLRRHAVTRGRPLLRAMCSSVVPATPVPSEAGVAAQEGEVQEQVVERPPPLSAEQLQRNSELAQRIKGQLVLAPLTRGGHLPYRRLCSDFGAEVTMSEMAFARHMLRGDRKELAILRRAASEQCYGVQIATNAIAEGVKAGQMVAEAGADWVDLNVGCPIYEASRRGLGAIMLRKPKKLARLVEGMASQLPIPLTVKIRIGETASKVNVHEVTTLLQEAGAAAVSIHGRTMEARYKKPADWELISDVAGSHTVPVIGNGDVLTHYEARRRMDSSGCLAVMCGRGALVKPWIFQEFKEGRELLPTAEERVGIYRQLVSHMKAHFLDDAKGKRKAFYFLPWHFNFFTRYRPMPEDVYGARSLQQPLISTRWESVACTELGERPEDLALLERLLRCENEAAFGPISEVLWDSASDAEAVAALQRLADANLAQWEAELRAGDERDRRGDDQQTEG